MKVSLLSTKSIFIIFISSLFVFVSCKNDRTLADGGWLQKRRYQKGYHLNIKASTRPENHENRVQKSIDPLLVASLNSEIQPENAKNDGKLIINQEPAAAPEVHIAEQTVNISEQTQVLNAPKIKVKEEIKSDQKIANGTIDNRKLNTLSLLSFIFGILSLFVLGIPFGVAAVICGIIGLSQCEKNPELYSGKGFAIVGLIIGLIAVIIILGSLASG